MSYRKIKANSKSKNDNTIKQKLFTRVPKIEVDKKLTFPVIDYSSEYQGMVEDENGDPIPTLFDILSSDMTRLMKYENVDINTKCVNINKLLTSETSNLFFQAELYTWQRIQFSLEELDRMIEFEGDMRINFTSNHNFLSVMRESLSRYINIESVVGYPYKNESNAFGFLSLNNATYLDTHDNKYIAFNNILGHTNNMTVSLYDKVFKMIGMILIEHDKCPASMDINKKVYSVMAHLDADRIFFDYHEMLVSIFEYISSKIKNHNRLFIQEDDE